MPIMNKEVTSSSIFSAEMIDINIGNPTLNSQTKTAQGEKLKPCFQTDERYFCKDDGCELANDCKKLIAAWMR